MITPGGGTEVLPSGFPAAPRLWCRRGNASDQCGCRGPQAVDGALGLGEALIGQQDQFGHGRVLVGEGEFGGDEARFQAGERDGVRKPWFRVVPPVPACAFGVGTTAAGEYDEVAAAEQGALVSGSCDSPGAMRWSTQVVSS